MTPRPRISVLIPVHNSVHYLDRCLASLGNSTYDNYECIIVDDASSDDSVAVAERYACRVIRLDAQGGPAAARNRAVSESDGEILFFVDSDVCVAPDSLERIVQDFAADPELDAVIGSYDDEPAGPEFLSQYRNLLHHFVHQSGSERASTFWSGCGAIRRDILLQYGGFNGEYRRPAIEDIELGYRMRADGRKILLDKQLQVKHLKVWTFRQIVKTDILDRGIPWTELILRDETMPADLNLRVSQRISVILAHLLVLSLAVLSWRYGGALILPILLATLLLLSNWFFYKPAAGAGRRGPLLWLSGVAMLSMAVAWACGMESLTPPFLLGLGMSFVQQQFLLPRRANRLTKGFSALLGLSTVGLGGYILSHIPFQPAVLIPALLLCAVLVLNRELYVFLTRRRNIYFTLAAVPFHLLYHFYNGISFGVGMILHWARASKAKRARQPAATIE